MFSLADAANLKFYSFFFFFVTETPLTKGN